MKIELAAAIREFASEKPWRKAGPGGIILFALEGAREETAYAVVTGRENGYTLALCVDAQALSDYALLLNARQLNTNGMEIISLQLQQNYLEFRISPPDEKQLNRWLETFGVETPDWPADFPVIRRHRPACLPQILDQEEEEPLAIALSAAVDWMNWGNAEKNQGILSVEQMKETSLLPCARWTGDGFAWSLEDMSDRMRIKITSPMLSDELAVRRIRKKPLSGAEFMCGVRMLPMPMDESAETVPILVMMFDSINGMVASPVAENLEADAEMLAGEFLGYVEEFGRPSCILAADMRAYCLLNGVAKQLGIPIEMCEDQDDLNEAMSSFLSVMKQSVEKTEEKQEQKKKRKAGNGICLLCGKEYTSAGMTSHLQNCVPKHREEGETDYFCLRVSDEYEPDYWMYLEVKKDASLRQVDAFLRETWLECCGHMSVFRIDGEEYLSYCECAGQRGMNAKLQDVFETGRQYGYDYDFGSTTSLNIQVVGEHKGKNRRKKVELIARNIMPKLACVKCGKPADMVFRPGGEPVAESVYCEECSQKDENAEFMLPLLNSPRTGVCSYGGWFGE